MTTSALKKNALILLLAVCLAVLAPGFYTAQGHDRPYPHKHKRTKLKRIGIGAALGAGAGALIGGRKGALIGAGAGAGGGYLYHRKKSKKRRY